jgi:hypothetical protein
MKNILDIRNIIIVVLILLCVVMVINPKGIMPGRIKYVEKIDSIPYPVHDTIPVDSLVEVPVEVPIDRVVEKIVEVPVVAKVDTTAIIDQYVNSKNIFTNTYKFTANQGSITIIDTISKNKIIGRKYTTKITPRTDTLRLPAIFKRELYLGVDARFDKPNYIQLLGVGVMFKTKTNMIYKVDLGVENRVTDGTNGKFTPYIGGGVYWKVGTKP